MKSLLPFGWGERVRFYYRAEWCQIGRAVSQDRSTGHAELPVHSRALIRSHTAANVILRHVIQRLTLFSEPLKELVAHEVHFSSHGAPCVLKCAGTLQLTPKRTDPS